MANLIIYMIESSAILVLLYMVYLVLMRKETFFDLNRAFLLGILIFSLLFPLLSFELFPSSESVIDRPIRELSQVRTSYFEALSDWSDGVVVEVASGDFGAINTTLPSDWKRTALISLLVIYSLGVVALLVRLIWICSWIGRLLFSHPIERIRGVKVVRVTHRIAPFSFLSYVFVYREMIEDDEFFQILEHEKTHIDQRHSYDLLFVQLLGAFLWFNPAIWLLIKSLKETHEYIADKKMITQGYSLVEYQTLLLRQLISNNSFGLVHNFNLSFIKKRITMMKNTKSGWSGKIRVSAAIVVSLLLGILVLQCNSNLENSVTSELESQKLSQESLSVPILPQSPYKINYDPDNVLNLAVKDNKLYVDDTYCPLDQLAAIIEKSGLKEHAAVKLSVEGSQSMGFVRDVQDELRKADKRKLLYIGISENKQVVELPMLLPPMPESDTGVQLPVIDEQFLEENNMDLLKIKLGDNAGVENQKAVHDFVLDRLANGRNYVVSAKFGDEDTYSVYLSNLNYIHEAFNQIYDERAQKLFGKRWWDIAYNPHSEGEYREQYNAVRSGIPRAISIAEE